VYTVTGACVLAQMPARDFRTPKNIVCVRACVRFTFLQIFLHFDVCVGRALTHQSAKCLQHHVGELQMRPTLATESLLTKPYLRSEHQLLRS
jgi:hypothetical protein